MSLNVLSSSVSMPKRSMAPFLDALVPAKWQFLNIF